MGRIIICSLCILAAAVLYFFTGSAAALVILCIAIVLPVAALLLAVLSAGSVSVKLELPSNIQKGRTVRGEILAENKSMIPILSTKLTLSVKNNLTGREENIPVEFSLGPRARRGFSFDFVSGYCGQYNFSCSEMRVFDFLGLRGIKKYTKLHEKRLVKPKTFPLQVNLSEGELITGNSESFHSPQKGQDASEPFQLRDYVEGDEQKQIHWKLSFKLDRLIVADPSRELERGLLVVWDNTALPQDVSPDVCDALAETLVSMCLMLAVNDIPFSLAYKDCDDGEVVVRDISTQEDLYVGMAGLLSIETQKAEMSSITDILRVLNGKKYPLIAYFAGGTPWELDNLAQCGNVTVFLCSAGEAQIDAGNFACRVFSPTNYKTVLRQITI